MYKFSNKKLLSFIFIIFLIKITFAQNNISNINKIKYTIIDSESKSIRPFLGSTSSSITFNLVELKNLDTDSIINGVEVFLSSNETMEAGNSLAFGNIGNHWGVSSSTIYKNIEESGYIFLDKNEMSSLLEFLNYIMRYSNQPQEKFTLYRISINSQFQIGMLYDPKNNINKKWEFIFTANEAICKMKFDKGVILLKRLFKFNEYLNK